MYAGSGFSFLGLGYARLPEKLLLNFLTGRRLGFLCFIIITVDRLSRLEELFVLQVVSFEERYIFVFADAATHLSQPEASTATSELHLFLAHNEQRESASDSQSNSFKGPTPEIAKESTHNLWLMRLHDLLAKANHH